MAWRREHGYRTGNAWCGEEHKFYSDVTMYNSEVRCGMIRESKGEECGDGLDRDKKQIN